jgi:hypothetical protein
MWRAARIIGVAYMRLSFTANDATASTSLLTEACFPACQHATEPLFAHKKCLTRPETYRHYADVQTCKFSRICPRIAGYEEHCGETA